MIPSANLGFPSIGRHRELKLALEAMVAAAKAVRSRLNGSSARPFH
jgi:hypothetical protein